MLTHETPPAAPGWTAWRGRWRPADDPPRGAAAGVDVFRFTFGVTDAQLAALRTLLEPAERDRARAMVEKRAREFVVSRAYLRSLLGAEAGLPAHRVRFTFGPHGKPEAAAPSGRRLRFSLSHSHGLGLIAILTGGDPATVIGVDVERIRPGVDHLAVARRFFSRRECRALAELEPELRERAFFRGWSCKEAVIKADGGGVGLGLGRFDVCLEPDRPPRMLATRWSHGAARRWTLLDLAVGPGYAGALALRAGPGSAGSAGSAGSDRVADLADPAPRRLRRWDLEAESLLPHRVPAGDGR